MGAHIHRSGEEEEEDMVLVGASVHHFLATEADGGQIEEGNGQHGGRIPEVEVEVEVGRIRDGGIGVDRIREGETGVGVDRIREGETGVGVDRTREGVTGVGVDRTREGVTGA